MINFGTAVVVENESGEILFIQREDFKIWVIPGGTLDHGETFIDGARREVFEETGVNVEITGLLGIFTWSNARHYSIIFTARPLDNNLTTSFESIAVRYFSRDNLPTPAPSWQMDRLEYYFRGEHGVIVAEKIPRTTIWRIRFLVMLRDLRNRYILKRPTMKAPAFTVKLCGMIDDDVQLTMMAKPGQLAWVSLENALSAKIGVAVRPVRLDHAGIDVDAREVQLTIAFERI
ncbi:MAG: NUDIX domain-containing protein [Chloroflexi bacterium]|nr:NUDIX domain-containing protein [Chloroflexota bacterium]